MTVDEFNALKQATDDLVTAAIISANDWFQTTAISDRQAADVIHLLVQAQVQLRRIGPPF